MSEPPLLTLEATLERCRKRLRALSWLASISFPDPSWDFCLVVVLGNGEINKVTATFATWAAVAIFIHRFGLLLFEGLWNRKPQVRSSIVSELKAARPLPHLRIQQARLRTFSAYLVGHEVFTHSPASI